MIHKSEMSGPPPPSNMNGLHSLDIELWTQSLTYVEVLDLRSWRSQSPGM